MTSIFNTHFVMWYRVENVKFTDTRTDAGNDNTQSAWKAKGLKWAHGVFKWFYVDKHLYRTYKYDKIPTSICTLSTSD